MNIKDVAVLAGVSSATVSRYLNNPLSVAKETAEKICRVVEVTGYRAERSSSCIDFKKNPTIGVVIPSLLNPVFSEVVAGIQERARYFGYSTLVLDTQYNSEQEKQAVIDLIRQRVVGVILTIADAADNEALSLLRDFKFPFCLLHNQSLHEEPCIYVDNYQAGRDVAAHLMTLGHRSLGMVTGHFISSDRALKRYQGFKEYLADRGIELCSLLEVDQNKLDPFDSEELNCAKGEQPTAWFCSNDLLALKLVNALREKKLRVPQDVSVVGFDGMSLGQLVNPPLSTVAVPHMKMGKIAVDILFNAKAGSNISTSFALDYQLRMTGTTDVAMHSYVQTEMK